MTTAIFARAQAPLTLAGTRFDRAAALLFPEHSRERLKAWIESGELTANGQVRKPTAKLVGGEWLELAATPGLSVTDAAEAMPLQIVFEDESLIVLHKPADLVVHPAAGHAGGTLLNGLLAHAPSLAQVPRAGIVHRLDKDTTGLLVIAKTLAAHTALVAAMKERAIKREYLALVHGAPPAEGSVEGAIGRDPRDRKRMALVATGKPALTYFSVLRRWPELALLRVTLATGRTHQIRVHLKSRGWPIAGDPVYGRSQADRSLPCVMTRQALHAERLSLTHPVTGQWLCWQTPLPADFAALLEMLDAAPA